MAALAAPQPTAVSLSAFTKADIHPADEVHVIGQINTAYNYTLTEQHNGYSVVRRMWVLFGPDDSADATIARAAILLPENQVDAFTDWALAGFVATTADSIAFRIAGQVDPSPELYRMADEALGKEGLTKSPDFIFIAPWLAGRAAGLAPRTRSDGLVHAAIPGTPGLISLLLAWWRFRRRNDVQKVRPLPVAPVMPQAMAAPAPALSTPAASRAALAKAKGKPWVLYGVGLVLVLIFSKQYWVFSFVPVIVILVVMFGIRKGLGSVADAVSDAFLGKPGAGVGAATPTVASAAQAPASFTASPGARPHTNALPPAIRSGFSFRDLLPKPRALAPQDDPYARLAASIREERLRRSTP
jgi:hypothetical protein